uniref:Uncharacterized protein n=1 Tax=Lactuca sativa TaxID=4236 RepID=A0A9R1W1C9_LACSA|nr:hypothetical protein LSAT_V11C400205490 [Lactuca sativa]
MNTVAVMELKTFGARSLLISSLYCFYHMHVLDTRLSMKMPMMYVSRYSQEYTIFFTFFINFVDMDRNHLLLFLLMCLATIRLWFIECEEKEAQRRYLSESTLESRLDTISKRSTEIQCITRESDEYCINELRMDKNAFALRFYRLGEIVSRYVHQVLGDLLHLQEILFVNPMPIANDCIDNRWKWFHNELVFYL